MIRVLVNGALGRMGGEVCKKVFAEPDLELVGAVDIKEGTIGHGGKTYTEWLKLQEKDEQPIGGDEPKLADNEVLLDGKVYVIKEK